MLATAGPRYRKGVHVIIAGCGRVGAQLATALDHAGHDTAIIDKDPAAFHRLGEGYAGKAVQGVVFDRGALEKGGAKQAQAFVAVTSGDNSNIVSARIAKRTYGIAQVVARIYDPDRAVIYERLGITTIAAARWTADEVLRILLPEGERVDAALGPGQSGEVVLVTLTVPDGVHGAEAAQLTRSGESVLAGITREGLTSVPVQGGLLEAGDLLHLSVQRDSVEDLEARVADLAHESR